MSKRDYSKGQIYKLCCLDPTITDIYVGSTLNFKNRKYEHKKNSTSNHKIVKNLKVYKTIRENGGFENWDMVLIKDFPCNDRKELHREENKIMLELKANLNMRQASRNNKQYYEDEKKTLLKKQKIKYEINKSSILKRQKQYRINNLDIVKKKQVEKIKCECGCILSRTNISTHKKSKKHLKLISALK